MTLQFSEYKPGIASSLRDTLMSHYRNQHTQILVNYGNSHLNTNGFDIVLNNPLAVAKCVDKPEALNILKGGGKKSTLYTSPACLSRGPVIIKLANHAGGKGHKVFDESYYVEEFVSCSHEWRVHVVGDRTCARMKTGGHGNIRNRRYGWIFSYSGEVPSTVRQAAIAAVKVMGLNFGAADIGERDVVPVVYEINTAPILEVSSVVEWYAAKMIHMIDRILASRRD